MNPNPVSRKRQILIIVLLMFIILLGAGFAIHHSSQTRKRQQSLLEQQQAAFAKTATTDPILKYLPYGTLDYNITPTFQKINGVRTLVLQVSVILTGADYSSSPQELQSSIQQKEQAALAYISSKGFDPSKYKIEYVVPGH